MKKWPYSKLFWTKTTSCLKIQPQLHRIERLQTQCVMPWNRRYADWWWSLPQRFKLTIYSSFPSIFRRSDVVTTTRNGQEDANQIDLSKMMLNKQDICLRGGIKTRNTRMTRFLDPATGIDMASYTSMSILLCLPPSAIFLNFSLFTICKRLVITSPVYG